MVLDTTQQLGWAWEAAAETDPINAVNALYWAFGVRTTQFKDDHPMESKNWSAVYTNTKKVPTDMELITTNVNGKYGLFPVNGVPLFKVLSESSSAGGAHTLTPLAKGGTQPTFTVRSESTGGTVDKFFSAVGCKATSVSGFINLLGPFKYLSEVLTWNGISAGASSSLNAIHTTGVMYPTSDYSMTAANQRKGRYKFDANTAFTWAGNDIIDDLTMLKYDIIHDHDVGHVENQAETEYIDEGDFTLSFDFGLWRGNTNTDAVRTDYDAGTQRDIVFTINNGPSYDRVYTWTNATALSMQGPYATLGDKKLWSCHGLAEDISIVVTDGVADDFYKD